MESPRTVSTFFPSLEGLTPSAAIANTLVPSNVTQSTMLSIMDMSIFDSFFILFWRLGKFRQIPLSHKNDNSTKEHGASHATILKLV